MQVTECKWRNASDEMTKLTLERYQIWFYLLALISGGVWGWQNAERAQGLEMLINLVLGILLYTTFCQVPLTQLREVFRSRRFMLALIAANFVLVPGVVWFLTHLLLSDPKLQFGVLLVLLVPCTDWFLTFTYLGKGNLNLAIAATPVLLLLQSLLLPMYLSLFTGSLIRSAIHPADFLDTFVKLILLPMGLAALTETWAKRHAVGQRWLRLAGWLPIPLLTLVLWLIAASQVGSLEWAEIRSLGPVILIFVVYLILAGYFAVGLARWLQLERTASRTLAFSIGTRNSFVVLPFALALSEDWSVVVTIVVIQPLIELAGMMVYLWWVPARLFRSRSQEELFNPRG